MSTSNGVVAPSVIEQLLARPPRRETLPLLIEGLDGEEVEVRFVFEALAPDAYDRLLMDHQPDDEQREVAPLLPWDQESFPPALIAACLVDPSLSHAEVVQLLGSKALNHGEAAEIFDAALRVNSRRKVRPSGKGSATIPPSEGLPPTP